MSENIKVAVRVRPFLPHEPPFGCVNVSENQIVVGDGRCFAFDCVLDASATSDDVYVALGQPLANSFLDGFSVSTIAYGQTGAGKTFTMSALSNDVVQELFCRLREEQEAAATKQLANGGFKLRVSALEVYNEHVGDLLQGKANTLKHVQGVTAVSPRPTPSSSNHSPTRASGTNGVASPMARRRSVAPLTGASINGGGSGGASLALREDPKDGVYVAGLSEFFVASEDALLSCIDNATANRKTATTLMNATSSRSHCVVTLTLQRRGVVSRCCFVDLAGSERFKKSLGVGMDPSISSPLRSGHTNYNNSSGTVSNVGSGGGEMGSSVDVGASNVVMERMREGISINGGLLALGNVIVALCEKKPHVPYRSSKLTRLLQPMLGGNSRTAMVACVSPLESSIEETLNTLKYANRAKSIKTNPHLVTAPSVLANPADAERIILALRKELESVQQQLAEVLSGEASGSSSKRQGRPQEPRCRTLSAASSLIPPLPRSRSQGVAGASANSSSTQLCQASRSKGRRGSSPALHSSLAVNGSDGDAPHAFATQALLRQISSLGAQLTEERAMTKRLSDDLFNAEYTVMIEVEKRRVVEERVAELEAMVTPNNEDGSSVGHTPNSRTESPRTRLTANMALLKKLEEERDSLQALKVRREEDKLRLSAAITDNGEGNTAAATAAAVSAMDNDSLVNDSAMAELSEDIEKKKKQVASLEKQNKIAARQLHEYERELEAIGSEKAKLEKELAKAEEMLEQSEIARQQKEEEKARLHAEYRERVRKAEERATDYRRRVKRAEQDMKMRSLNIQRIDLLKNEVERLREETAKQRVSKRAELKKGVQLSTAHAHEVSALQRQLHDAEQQVAKLQGNLQRKDEEIARVKVKVGGPLPPTTLTPGANGGIASARHAAAAAAASRTPTQSSYEAASAASIQPQIDEEVRKLERLEKELQELQESRRMLAQMQTTDAPKYQTALKGFVRRQNRIELELEAGAAADPPLSDTARARLESERYAVAAKLRQLESFQRMFDEAKQQLEEFDDRIDSLNEARRYHLHRVRRLQHARTDSPSSVSGGTSPAHSGTTVQQTSTGSLAPLPSVREITTARQHGRLASPSPPFSVTPAESSGPLSGPASVKGASVGAASESRAVVSERRYIKQLEETVELLKKESQGLRTELERGHTAAAVSRA